MRKHPRREFASFQTIAVVGAFKLIFEMFLCPANFHSREADGKFVKLPQSANADSSLWEGAKVGRLLR